MNLLLFSNRGRCCLSSFKLKIFAIALTAFMSGIFIPQAHAMTEAQLGVTQITAVQTFAQNDNSFEHGWRWVFDVTVPTDEVVLKMKFADWTGLLGNIPAAGNIRFYSLQSSNASDQATAIAISAANNYAGPMNLSPQSDLDSSKPGRQIQIVVEAKIPTGTPGGSYSTSYGIYTEKDNVKPVITMLGTTPLSLEVHLPYLDAGATAVDNIDGDLTNSITTQNDVNKDVLGAYVVSYNVTDFFGNHAEEVKRVVNVVDTTKPVIQLNGDNPQTVEINAPYQEQGATVSDNYDSGLQAVIDSSAIDTSKLGTYSITYNAEDSSHNKADQKTRVVEVIDTTKPVISLNGESEISMKVGNPYVDAGAIAHDNVDGDVTLSTLNSVNTNQVGDYVLRYNYTDSSHNAAGEVTRLVHVTPREVTVAAEAKSKVFGSADPELTYKVGGEALMPGDVFSGSLNRIAGENAGSYDIQLGSLALGDNYHIAYSSAKLTITPAVAQVLLGDLNQTYNGTPRTVSVTTLPSGIPTEVTYNHSPQAPTSAGNYDAAATITDPNYSGSAAGTLVVSKAPVSISAVTQSKEYDNTTKAVVTLTVSGAVAGDQLSAVGDAAFADKDVGHDKTVNVTNIQLKGDSKDNYSHNETAATTADITARPLNITASAASKVYDGNTTAGSVTIGTDAFPEDHITASGNGYFFATRDVGENKSVNIVGITVSGAGLPNYHLEGTNGLISTTTKASITPKELTITGLTANNKPWDSYATTSLSGTAALVGVASNPDDNYNLDNVQLTGVAEAVFDNPDVGEGKPVTVTGYQLSGVHAHNYTLVQPAGLKADITWSNLQPGNLKAEDFGIMNQSDVKGYSAGFSLENATFQNVKSIVVRMYSGETLLQTNTATANFGQYVTEAQISSPFDIFGTFSYSGDTWCGAGGCWTNKREVEYGLTLIPTKVTADVVLANGKVLHAENTNPPSGDRGTIVPPAVPQLELSSNPTEANITKSSLISSTGGKASNNGDVEALVTAGLGPIAVTLRNTGTGPSENVRINPIGVTSNLQLWAKDTSGNWYDINVTGWGPAEGFVVPAGQSATTQVYPISSQAGEYTITANLVLASDPTNIKASATGVVHVTDPAPAPSQTSVVTQIKIVTNPQTIKVDTASSVIKVESQDSSNKLLKVADTTYVKLTSDSNTGVFSTGSSSDGTCGTEWLSTRTITISKGDAHAGFCYKDSSAGAHTLTASSDHLISGIQVITVE